MWCTSKLKPQSATYRYLSTMSLPSEGSFEKSVGILSHINSEVGFQGILKQRFSDFVVRELDLKNRASYLNSISPKELQARHFPDGSDIEADDAINGFLESLRLIPDFSFDAEVEQFLHLAFDRSEDCPQYFILGVCKDKKTRGAVHGAAKAHVLLRVETDTEKNSNGESSIRMIAKHKVSKGKGNSINFHHRKDWPAGLGDFLKFTLAKENVDTMSATNMFCKNLRCQPTAISYAGTKDKRGITFQSCTMYRRKPVDIARLNNSIRGPLMKIGDFEYVQQPLQLGDLSGNHFDIALRNINIPSDTKSNLIEVISNACKSLKANGFINYFGLQRFGKGGVSSDKIGLALFKQSWTDAVHMLFAPREGDLPDIQAAKEMYQQGDLSKALQLLPHKMFGERSVLEHLVQRPGDYYGAYHTIPKQTRMMCAHAYQSYLWNMAASKRISEHGMKCIVGDIVLSTRPSNSDDVIDIELDKDMEEDDDTEGGIPVPDAATANDPTATAPASTEPVKSAAKVKAYVITEADISGNEYSIRDVVLPLVGYDSVLPRNSIGTYYEELMEKNQLSLSSFGTTHTTYRMKGTYRRLIETPKDFDWKIVSYSDPADDILCTELHSRVSPASADSSAATPTGTRLCDGIVVCDAIDAHSSSNIKLYGLWVSFSLCSSTYATMLLRELMKESTETVYQSNLTQATLADPPNKATPEGEGKEGEDRAGKKQKIEK